MAPARKKKTTTGSGITKMPTVTQLEKMKADDAGYAMAKQDAVKFLQSRKQAVYNIARTYHLDPDELFQEGFEVLLTCVRDYAPVYEKADGTFITVQFTTFFGSRMDSKGKELRNTNPEYQARQAMVSDMSDDEKQHFRENPPLLVQHLDHENPMQEMLRGEASSTKDDARSDASLKWAQDGFFDQKLTELVAREQDEKKRTILMQIKMGGVFNFQEMAYHFGVTDSRASQLLNELMDAFYIQRMIDGTVESVIYDFKKLKFNEKRILRLVQSALGHATSNRQQELQTEFHKAYPELAMAEGTATPALEEAKGEAKSVPAATNTPQVSATVTSVGVTPLHSKPKPLADVLTEKEQQKCPKLGAEQRKIADLTLLPEDFRPPATQLAEEHTLSPYIQNMAEQPELYPLMISEEGLVIDGARRLQALQEAGKTKAHCTVHHVPEEKDAHILRIGVNIRRMEADKIDIYWAIVALANLGLSQQKIADALGTSRTNVIVYAKVKDKASLPLRQLFEDGLIQITNASACVEFSEKVQERAANFIRTFGANWGKGAQFTELFEAAKHSKLTQLEKKTAAQHTVVNTMPATPTGEIGTTSIAVATDAQTKERLQAYETALRDAEAWTAQRESVINRQTEDITAARSEIESLKKELEAAELTKYGDESSVKEALKELKAFISLTERMSAATLNTLQATKAMRPLKLTRSQLVEVQELLDTLDQHTNALRLEVANKAKLKPKITRTTEEITL